MKTIKDIKDKKVPVVLIDKSLNKYDNVILFPEKVAKANEVLLKVGIPEIKADSISPAPLTKS